MVAVAVIASATIGIIYALAVPYGLPYDEPSYWSTTQWYGHYHHLPILGQPGVSYEAQHPPLAFVIMAIGRGIALAFGASESASIVGARLAAGVQMLIALVILDRILRRLLRSDAARFVGLITFGTAPMFVAMGWSVSNDITAILFGLIAVEVLLAAHTRPNTQPTLSKSLLAGLAAGLALLAKITVWPLIPVFVVWLIWRYRSRLAVAAQQGLAFLVGVALPTLWWFVWNMRTYHRLVGDPGAQGGPVFDGSAGFGVGTGLRLVKKLFTYLWLPTEYYRNSIHASAVLQGVIGLASISIVCLASWAVFSDRKRAIQGTRGLDTARGWSMVASWLLVAGVGLAVLAVWVVFFLVVRPIAPRTAYLAIPVWVACTGIAADSDVAARLRLPPRGGVVALVVLLIALNVWTLLQVTALDRVAFSFT